MIEVENLPSETYNRNKAQPGAHVCKIKNIREKHGFKGVGFWLDLEVESGPSGAGFEFSLAVYPTRVQPPAHLTMEQAIAKEKVKIRDYVAHAYGYAKPETLKQTEYAYAIQQTPVSPLAGRKIIIEAVAHTNKKGGSTVYYVSRPVEGQPAVVVSATEAPPAPAPIAASFPPPGWAAHPSAPGFFYKGQEVVSEADLRARGK